MMKIKKLTNAISLIAFSFSLTSCSGRAIKETFVSYASSDEKIIFNVQASKEGGNGRALIKDQFREFYWMIYKDELAGMRIFLCIPDLDATEDVIISPVKTTYDWKQSTKVIKFCPLSDFNRFFKEDILLYKEELEESEINAKNFLNTCLKNDDISLTVIVDVYHFMSRNDDWMKARWGGSDDVLHFFFMEGDTFEFQLDSLKSTGTYTTSKTQVLFQFETDSIFNLKDKNVSFNVVECD